MALRRTTIMLDEEARRAARELGEIWGVTASAATRRALVQQREWTSPPPPPRRPTAAERKRRRAAFLRLCELFEGYDPTEELRQRRLERRYW